jgi:hypothetical protein
MTAGGDQVCEERKGMGFKSEERESLAQVLWLTSQQIRMGHWLQRSHQVLCLDDSGRQRAWPVTGSRCRTRSYCVKTEVEYHAPEWEECCD